MKDKNVTLRKGTSLFIYTDGVTEAENKTKVLYFDERLLDLLDKQRRNMPQTIVDIVWDDVNKHTDEAEQSDSLQII